MTSQIAANTPVIGPQWLMICPSGVKANIVSEELDHGHHDRAIFCQSPAKNAEMGFQLATIKPAARAMPVAINTMGWVLSTMFIRSNTWVAPVTAVCIAENAMAPAASPSTSFGLSLSKLPTANEQRLKSCRDRRDGR